MNNTLSLSVILPIKSAKAKDFDELFGKAINSLKEQKVDFEELVIVHTQEETLITVLDNYDFGNINVTKVLWDKEPSYAEQVNYGIKNAKGEWVSLFEFDDEYSSIWFKNVKTYIEAYPETQVFLPVVVETDEKGTFAGFTNEATFAANFTQELGYLTNETLQMYQNFQIAGMVIKKETFLEFGKFKSNIKLTFGYEFFLRMTHASVKFLTIPKIGYKHMNLREGSIFWNYKNGEDRLSEDEAKFWIEAAKKEYFYTAQRDIKYEPQEI